MILRERFLLRTGALSLFLFDPLVTFDPSMLVNSGSSFVHSELDGAQVKDKMICLRSAKKGD